MAGLTNSEDGVVRETIHALLGGLLGLVAFVTAVAWLGEYHPVLELLSNLRWQLALVAGFAGVLGLVTGSWGTAVSGLAIGAINLAVVAPYLMPTPDAVTDAPTAKVMQYNVEYSNERLADIAALINESDADVVSIQEITDLQWRELQPLLLAYPYRLVAPVSANVGELGGGMALVSRMPMADVEITSPSNLRSRPMLAGVTTVAGRAVTVMSVHPHASRLDDGKVALRQTQIDTIIYEAARATTPVVVLTDLNVAPTSSEYKRLLDETGWRDPHRLVGWNATWPSAAAPLGLPLDHIFVSDEVLLHDYHVGDGAGSDHKTLTATISIP